MSRLRIDRPTTPEEAAAIAAALALVLAEESQPCEAAMPALDAWRVAARIEALGIVRRIPGRLDLRYLGTATRERLTRPLRDR